LPVSLDCSFLIAPSVFSNIYSLISSKIYTGVVSYVIILMKMERLKKLYLLRNYKNSS